VTTIDIDGFKFDLADKNPNWVRTVEWQATLQTGDLVLCYIANQRGDRPHLITLEERKLTAKKNEAKLLHKKFKPDIEEDSTLLTYWIGTGLCGADGRTGRGSRYYSRPAKDNLTTESGVCAKCRSRWNALGKPVVKGWTDVPKSELPSPAWLPFGWKEVPPVGHPWDVPEGGDPATVLDKEGHARGVLRTEVKRWVRGARYVRIVKHHDPERKMPYGLCDGWLKEPLQEETSTNGSAEVVVRDAVEIMAAGGRPAEGNHLSGWSLRRFVGQKGSSED